MSRRARLILAAAVALSLAIWVLAAGPKASAQGHGEGHGSSEHAAPTTHAPAGEHAAPAGEHGEHGAAEHGAHHGPAPINWTDIWNTKQPAVLALVINFGLLMGLYYVLGKKPITEALKQRRITIGKEIDDAQALLAEAKERGKKYQADLKNADTDAETARSGLVSAGKGEVDRILSEAEERAERMKRDAERLVEQEKKQLAVDLLLETIEVASSEAGKILAKSVTAEDHARLAQDLLAELAKKPAAPRAAAAGSVRPGGAA
ncbi:MAG: hypothetical protein KF819_04410 [Labilithrix sp.]|nr:hypothetical protein [Labilithrix sp.]